MQMQDELVFEGFGNFKFFFEGKALPLLTFYNFLKKIML
jgi:hypothetical protein